MSEKTIRATVNQLKFSPTLAINERVKQIRAAGQPVFHLGFGESPFPAHPLIQQALAANADKNAYLPTAGLPGLRASARNYLADKSGFDGREFEAIIGPGSKELIYDLQLAVAGDLLLPIPSWVSYGPQAALLGDAVIKIPTTLADHHHITAESLERAIVAARQAGKNPSKLILNYPNNPSGLSLSAERLESIAQVCRRYSILIISDEIYGLVHHRGEHVSMARFYPQGTVVTGGLSKHLSLGGYRLGVALVPKRQGPLFDALLRIASGTWSTVAAPMQFAALTAFEKNEEIEAYIHACAQIHRLVSGFVRDAIVALGVSYPQLDGAFYLYPNFGPLLQGRGIKSSEQLAADLLERVQVVTLPGTAFGDEPRNLTLRLAACDFDGQAALDYYAAHPDSTAEALVDACGPHIKQACERLAAYLTL